MAGIKHDNGKLRWGLLPWREVETVVEVLEHGAKKYGEDNWQAVPNAKLRYSDAAFRHIIARVVKGEIHDKESGLPHLAHAICCLLFIMWMDKQ